MVDNLVVRFDGLGFSWTWIDRGAMELGFINLLALQWRLGNVSEDNFDIIAPKGTKWVMIIMMTMTGCHRMNINII